MAKKQNKKPVADNKSATGLNKKKQKPNTLKVRFLTLPSAKYQIAGNVGQVKTLPTNQAMEMIDNGDAEIVK